MKVVLDKITKAYPNAFAFKRNGIVLEVLDKRSNKIGELYAIEGYAIDINLLDDERIYFVKGD